MIQTLRVSIDCMSRFHSPLMQMLMPSAFLKAGMVDKRPRKHVGRSVFTDQAGFLGWLGRGWELSSMLHGKGWYPFSHNHGRYGNHLK